MKDRCENTYEDSTLTWNNLEEGKYSLDSLQKDFRKGQSIWALL